MAISFLFFNRLVISIDPLALTAFSICGRWDYMLIVPILAIGSGMLTMIGQNFGRKNFQRVLHIWKVSLLTMVGVMAFLATILVLLAPKIYPFFSKVDEVIKYAVLQTRIVEYSFILGGIAMLARSSFQAIGRATPGLIITIIRIIGVALPVAYFYVYVMELGIYGVWFGLITGNLIAAIIALLWVRKTLKSYISEEGMRKEGVTGLQEEVVVD
jgi:Na+-driven multidrug efflux pump